MHFPFVPASDRLYMRDPACFIMGYVNRYLVVLQSAAGACRCEIINICISQCDLLPDS